MKKILLIAVLIGAMLSVSAYVVCIATPLLGKSIKGSGHIVTRTLPAPDFNAVDASRAVKVVISAEASDIRIEADDNLIDLVVAETRGKTLEVTLDQKVNNIQNANITVTVPANGGNIRSLKASSASKITGDVTLRADKFTIAASSAAEINAAVEATSCSVDASSAAKIRAAVEAASCSIEASSASKVSAEVKATTCTVGASSASKIALTGSAENFTADLSSASKLDAAKFTAVNATVSTSSAAKVEIDCSGKLTASASSGSSIGYTGDCHTSLSKSSGGSVRKN